MALFQQEEVHECFVVIGGYSPNVESPTRVEAIGLVRAGGFVQTVFGYPNEQAYWKDPRGEFDHGIFEIRDSRWFSNIDDYNARTFGGPWFGAFPRPELHHYFIGGKDASCQILAKELELQVITDKAFGSVCDDVRRIMFW